MSDAPQPQPYPEAPGPTGYGPQPGYGPPAYAPPGQPGYHQYSGYSQVPPEWAPFAYFPKPLGWLIAAWLIFWPLGLWALVSPWQNIERALWSRDLARAQHEAKKVKRAGIIAICVAAGWVVLFIALFATVGVVASHSVHSCRIGDPNC